MGRRDPKTTMIDAYHQRGGRESEIVTRAFPWLERRAERAQFAARVLKPNISARAARV
jgi:hypothetical protein